MAPEVIEKAHSDSAFLSLTHLRLIFLPTPMGVQTGSVSLESNVKEMCVYPCKKREAKMRDRGGGGLCNGFKMSCPYLQCASNSSIKPKLHGLVFRAPRT